MKKLQKLHKYIFAATVISLQIPVSATAQVQELNVQRDTISTYLKVQNKGIVNMQPVLTLLRTAWTVWRSSRLCECAAPRL